MLAMIGLVPLVYVSINGYLYFPKPGHDQLSDQSIADFIGLDLHGSSLPMAACIAAGVFLLFS